jgi:(p)ppGpp synthase/HD superfamily hydrolase
MYKGFTFEDLDLINKAIAFSITAHHQTNQTYGDHPYSVHLAMVANNAWKYIHLLDESEQAIAIASCWTHDTIEDARQTYNDVKKATSESVAEITRLVSNYSRGVNRDARMPDWLYKEIAANKVANFVKVCDRLANIQNSFSKGHSMAERYAQEYQHFYDMLYREEFKPMFDEMINYSLVFKQTETV